jgi:hypothetical protein
MVPLAGVEGGGTLPHVYEDVLGDVLGGRPVAGDPHRQPVDQRRELVVQLFERGLVAVDEPLAQRLLPVGTQTQRSLHAGPLLPAVLASPGRPSPSDV